jgi:hypothetical protein
MKYLAVATRLDHHWGNVRATMRVLPGSSADAQPSCPRQQEIQGHYRRRHAKNDHYPQRYAPR